jgi:2-beta-glucuronyltransferase
MTYEVVLFSEHVYESGRRAGFHWLVDAYRDAGWRATFVTVGVSPISSLRGDFRMGLVPPDMRNKFRRIADNLLGYFWYPPFHPVNLRSHIANLVCTPVFRSYAAMPIGQLAPAVQRAKTIIVESCAALALVPRLRQLSPQAFLVYRVSDDVRVVGHHPVLREFEAKALPYFDLISVPSDHMVKIFPDNAPVEVQYHGLNMSLLDSPSDNPYRPGFHVVSVGTTLFDREAVEVFAKSCPDVTFHLFGRMQQFAQKNVVLYGERPFVELIPFLQHADVGLAPYIYKPGCEYLAHTSNKVMQYTYCQKPVLLPSYIPNRRQNIVPYKPHDCSSAIEAIALSRMLSQKPVDNSWIQSWSVIQEAIEDRRPLHRQALR